MLVGNRIPKSFFITSGAGESDIAVHAGSYHLALRQAGIERCNIITYSSILPAIATETKMPTDLVHGSVLETIMAQFTAKQGELATAGLIFGWLYDKVTGKKYGGLVCEYSGKDSEESAKKSLLASLNELYINGYSQFDLRDVKIITKGVMPKKRFGTVLVCLCFTDYVYPILENNS